MQINRNYQQLVSRLTAWGKQHPIAVCLALGLVFLKALDLTYPLNLPQNNHFFARVVVDENNRPLRTFADGQGVWRYPVKLSQVSPLYIEALLNYEDRWFWHHPGINPMSLLRATVQNIKNGRIISGGSTLSMQVARILHPHSRSLPGKAKQILRTLQLEWHLDKEQILELYLNTAPFGGTIEGVQAASFSYLNKPAAELSHSEAALLAVLPQAPTRLRPDLHHQAAQTARDKVLKRMADLKVWSKEVVDDARLEQVYSASFRPPQLAPLLSRRLLSHSDGQSVVKSTINGDLQQGLEDMLASYMGRLPKQSSAAVLVVDNHTSAVKAYIGTADFANASRYGYVDMVQATRSPGSTLKPFLYALAMDEGLIHSHSLLADVPRNWGDYRPSNFSGAFNGPVSAAEALQRSLNMPAVDLLERYGSKRFAARLQNAGLKLSIPGGKPNLAVSLGGAGSSLEQLVQAYSAFANEGKTSQLRFLQQELSQPKFSRALLSPQSAWVVQNLLSQIDRPGSLDTLALTSQDSKLAWKTGTSYGFRDSWAIGVSEDYTVGVWLGRPDGSAMPGHHGRITAGPLLFTITDKLLKPGKQTGHRQIARPENIARQHICWPLGTLEAEQPEEFCQQKHLAWIIDEQVPATWHQADSDAWQSNRFTFWQNPETGLRVSMNCQHSDQPIKKQARQVALWPKILEPWLDPNQRRDQLIPQSDPSCRNNSLAPGASLKITGIVPGSIYRKSGDSGQVPSIKLKSIGGSGNSNWYINGKHSYRTPAGQSKEHLLTSPGEQQIIVQDQQGNTDMVTISVL
ncbi:penicillin-binding protein 1C [Thalassomonas viridans]|uniref:peptidoglycan glycosyltransferase n=1 Tax=Thalassomonas viridans TaxID=137584 RepID=A0AAF0C9U4_9GAMM|nr:penicillin-binding protein 1C [Thalassomonas viridans]WDE06163.1 penicillin-binding protein 1C [Thalassomonas viridans]